LAQGLEVLASSTHLEMTAEQYIDKYSLFRL